MATEGAIRGGWAAEVACGLAEAWSAAGLRMVLADAGLEGPTLHAELSIPNGEGLSDALLWGASVKRVARAVRDRGFYVITAGTPVADAAQAFAGPRWGQLCDGFRDSGVNLAVLIPTEEAATAGVLSQATDVVVLATPEEDVASIAWDVLGMVRRVVGLESGMPFDLDVPELPSMESDDDEVLGDAWKEAVSEAVLEFADPLHEAPSVPEEVPADLQDPLSGSMEASVDVPDAAPMPDVQEGEEVELSDPLHEARGMEDPLVAATPPVDEAPAPPPPPTFEEIVEETSAAAAKPKGSGRRNALLVVLLMVLVGVVAAAWLGYVDIPGITPAGGGPTSPPAEAATEEPVVAAPAPEVPAPTEITGLLGFSLAIASYQDPAEARRRSATLAAAVPDVLFAVIPVSVNGTVYHRVMAGPATDSADAAALASHVANTARLDPAGWVIRATSGAFHLGETDELATAQERADELSQSGLPAYVMAVDYSDGSIAYRIYVGAYADEAEAAYLSSVLAEQGLGRATFSHRTGRLPE